MFFISVVFIALFTLAVHIYFRSRWNGGNGESGGAGSSPVSPDKPDAPPSVSPPDTDRVVKDEEFIDYLKRFQPQNRFIEIEETEKEI